MRQFKRAGWAFLFAAAVTVAAAQTTDTSAMRVKSNVRNNRQSAQAETQGTAPSPYAQEGKIKSHSNSANNVHDTAADARVKSHSNSTNNREAQTGPQVGVTAEAGDRIKTKSNIKNDRTASAPASNEAQPAVAGSAPTAMKKHPANVKYSDFHVQH